MAVKSGDSNPRTGTEYVPFTQEQAKYLNAGGYSRGVDQINQYDPLNPTG